MKNEFIIIIKFTITYRNIHCFLFQIPERNLNPKAACLKRREEEKAEDGPKLPGHLAAHISHPHPHPHAHTQQPFPTMPVSQKNTKKKLLRPKHKITAEHLFFTAQSWATTVAEARQWRWPRPVLNNEKKKQNKNE